jgi:F0F1-type ATP synthase membrane subunit b/b'
LLAQYQQKQREAAAEAEAMIAHARDEASRIAAQAARDLEDALGRRRRLAEERIAQAETKARQEIRAVAADAAIGAARAVIVREWDRVAAARGGARSMPDAALPQRALRKSRPESGFFPLLQRYLLCAPVRAGPNSLVLS